jgi:hypothetical protein
LTSKVLRGSRAAIEGRGKRQRLIAFPAPDREDLRFRTSLWMDIERSAIGDRQALGGERFDAEIVGSRCDSAFDLRAQQVLEHAEERVLKIDRQREEPIEEGRDRRQVFAQAAVIVGEAQSCGILERLQRTAFDPGSSPGQALARVEEHVELPQGRAAIDRLQIVVGAEQSLPAGLALAACDGAERVEPASDRAEESLLGFDVGGYRPEEGRLRLVGPVGAPEALDCGIGLPSGLQEIMDAKAAVSRCEVSVIAAARATGVAEH